MKPTIIIIHGAMASGKSTVTVELDKILKKDITKFATHGFWGTVIDLLELYKDQKYSYSTKHMVKTREAIKQHKQARIMENKKKILRNITWHNDIIIDRIE